MVEIRRTPNQEPRPCSSALNHAQKPRMAVQLVESMRVGRKAKLRIVCLIGVAKTEADLVAIEAKSRA